jgi:hypothetical protein
MNKNRVFFKGGKGYAKAIIFDNIMVNQIRNPIYIQQHYMGAPEQVNILSPLLHDHVD